MTANFQVVMQFTALLVGLALLSALLTRTMIFLAPALGLVDHPSERRIHTTPIPRAGGIAVFLTLLCGILILPFIEAAYGVPLLTDGFPHFVAAAGLVVAIGVIDDRFGMSAWIKLAGQALAAALYFFHDPGGGGSLLGHPIPWGLDLAIHVAWTVLLINGFNLIDGMDGLCGGLGLIASLLLGGLALMHGSIADAVFCGLLSASLAGFLLFNFHPARIFLGDAGSMLIGFFIATVGASAAGRSSATAAILLPLLVGGVPLLDVALAVWRRAAKRFAASKPGQATTKIFGPDKHHLHHRLMDWGLTQRRASFVIYGLAIILAVLGMLPIIGGVNWLAMSLIGLFAAVAVGIRYLAPIELISSGNTLRALVRRPLPSRLYAFGYFLWDLMALAAGSAFAWWVLSKVTLKPLDLPAMAGGVAVFAGCGIVALRLSSAQTRRWSRACVYEYAEVGGWLCCGITASYAILSWSEANFSFIEASRHIIGGAVALGLLVLPRLSVCFLLEGVIDTMHRKKRLRTKQAARTTVLYGAGDLGELFLCHLRLSEPGDWKSDHIIGFIDDHPALVGRRLRGFKILGTSAALGELAKKHRFDTVMITQTTLTPEKVDALAETCRSLGLNLRSWVPSLTPESLHIGRESVAGSEQAPPPSESDAVPASSPPSGTPSPDVPRQGRDLEPGWVRAPEN